MPRIKDATYWAEKLGQGKVSASDLLLLTEKKIADIFENSYRMCLSYTKVFLWSSSFTAFNNQCLQSLRKEPRGSFQPTVCNNRWKKKTTEAPA